jgi:hypothetical protein
VTPTFRCAAMTSTKASRTAAALNATLGLATASWVVAVQQLRMDVRGAIELGVMGVTCMSVIAALLLA